MSMTQLHAKGKQRRTHTDGLDHAHDPTPAEQHISATLLDTQPIPDVHESLPEPKVPGKLQGQVIQAPLSGPSSAFVEIFEHTMALMPSGLALRGLLAPFSSTGEEHLQDLASRVRVFKTAFDAWVEIHQPSFNGLPGHLNIVQRLRNAHDSIHDVKTAIQSYDSFRSYIHVLGSELFPGTNLLGDHLTLHASFYNAGRGIVLTLGEHQVYMVMTSIRSLRGVGCKLPIEIMYHGEEDLGQEYREMLEGLPDVVTRDMSKMIDDSGWELRGLISLSSHSRSMITLFRLGIETVGNAYVLISRSSFYGCRCAILFQS